MVMDEYEYLDMLTIKKEIDKNVKDRDAVISGVARFLRTTSTYRECRSLYDYYVLEVAKFIRNFDFFDSIEATLFLDYLLRNGFLSSTGHNIYHMYNYDTEYLFDLMGARTISGVSICRHMASLVTDVLNVDYIAGWLNVKSGDTIRQLRKEENLFNHAVVGVENSGSKIIYDPTVSAFAGRVGFNFGKIDEINRISEVFHSYLGTDRVCKYFLINSKRAKLKDENWDEAKIVYDCPMLLVDEDTFRDKVKKIDGLCKHNFLEISDFVARMKELTINISELEKELTPRSDEPIKKWLVRK